MKLLLLLLGLNLIAAKKDYLLKVDEIYAGTLNV